MGADVDKDPSGPGPDSWLEAAETVAGPGSMKAREAYQALSAGIENGHYPPGMRLLEVKLAKELGMSRTPVREAIRRLVSDGVVEMVANRGARVRGWTPEDIEEAYALRATLEGFCASRAAMRMSQAEVERLAVFHRELEDQVCSPAPDVNRMIELNDLFHRAIVAASGNSKASEVMPQAANAPRSVQIAFWSTERIRQTAMVFHRELLEALRSQDPFRAEAVARSHVFSVKDFIFEYQRDILDVGKPID